MLTLSTTCPQLSQMCLIMAHLVISVLSLDSALQTLLTSFDKKVGLKARPNGLRVRMLSYKVVTPVNSLGGKLVSINYGQSPLRWNHL